jgi:hypothetical protein
MAYTGNWSIDDSALKDAFAAVLAKPASAGEFLVAIQKLAAGDGPAAVYRAPSVRGGAVGNPSRSRNVLKIE